jgi:flavin reductase (DIM6/NTAB) family NADH-FMN oxidoreductase RutF
MIASDRPAVTVGRPARVDLRPFMDGFPSGISVVTSLGRGAMPSGLTCSSLARVALCPPTVMVSIRTASPTLTAATERGGLAVNILHEGARATADLFASGDPDRFERVQWRLPEGAAGPHLIADAHAVADCAIVRTLEIGTYSAVFAEVTRVTLHDVAEPLLYARHRYARWSDAASVPPPRPAVAAADG